MNNLDVLKILSEAGAFLSNGHFVYNSRRHGRDYVDKDELFVDAQKTSMICREIALKFSMRHVEVVVAPAVGAALMSQWVVAHLMNIYDHFDQKVWSIYAEKNGQSTVSETGFTIRPTFRKYIARKRVLVLDDILHTGKTTRGVIRAVRALEGDVIGVGAICDRGLLTTKDLLDVPELCVLASISPTTWPEDKCLLCEMGLPISLEAGKGREFVERKKKLVGSA